MTNVFLTALGLFKSKLQNCTLTCRSRELEGDGGSEEEGTGTPACSLISFAEFNHGAVKNKVCTYLLHSQFGLLTGKMQQNPPMDFLFY